MSTRSLTVFADSEAVATGDSDSAISTVKAFAAKGDPRTLLVFDDVTGEQVDLDLRDNLPVAEATEATERRGPGRPRLGVVGREVTLLPRHWEWLNAQPGGASVALRKLVERASRDNAQADRARRSREAAFRFMTVAAGNERGFEEACRALFARDREAFESQVTGWPRDVAAYTKVLADGAFVGVDHD